MVLAQDVDNFDISNAVVLIAVWIEAVGRTHDAQIKQAALKRRVWLIILMLARQSWLSS